MNTEREWEEFSGTIKANGRGHADFWSWRTDRTVQELGVVQELHESLESMGEAFFHSCKSRETDDPPDCEALSDEGKRIGIEVTELVDDGSIQAMKKHIPWERSLWEPWTPAELHERIQTVIGKKDNALDIKGGPYSQYVLVIYCDDPRALDYNLIQHLKKGKFNRRILIDRVFFLMSCSPWEKSCPFIELSLDHA